MDIYSNMLKVKKYSKLCPDCNSEQIYTCSSSLTKAINLNTLCNKCSHKEFKKFLVKHKTRVIFSNANIENIKTLYLENGLSCENIGKEFKTSSQPIKTILKKLGILRKGYSNGIKINLSEKQEDIIKKMYLIDYKNTKEIGYKLNVSETLISKFLVKNKLKRTISEGNFIGKVMKFHNISPDEYLKQLPEFKRYRRSVDIITRQQPIETLKHFKLRGNYKKITSYHLDHKYSVLEGFKNKISPEIIGNINNLEFIPFKENLSKSSKCSIKIEDLITQ